MAVRSRTGLGTVGRGVVEILRERHASLMARAGVDVQIGRVFDRSWQKKQALASLHYRKIKKLSAKKLLTHKSHSPNKLKNMEQKTIYSF